MLHQERADQISEMIETQMGIRGKSLEAQLRKAGRSLPRKVRLAAEHLVNSAQLERHPKLARLIDAAQTEAAYEICQQYLHGLNVNERRKAGVISFLTTNAFNFLAISVLLIAVLRWRGFI